MRQGGVCREFQRTLSRVAQGAAVPGLCSLPDHQGHWASATGPGQKRYGKGPLRKLELPEKSGTVQATLILRDARTFSPGILRDAERRPLGFRGINQQASIRQNLQGPSTEGAVSGKKDCATIVAETPRLVREQSLLRAQPGACLPCQRHEGRALHFGKPSKQLPS